MHVWTRSQINWESISHTHGTWTNWLWIFYKYSYENVVSHKPVSLLGTATMVPQPILHLTLLSLIISLTTLSLVDAADPTFGFTPLGLSSSSNLQIQKPYDVAVNERYSFSNGVHRFLVYSSDKPHMQGSATEPRTEIRITVSLNSHFFLSFFLIINKCKSIIKNYIGRK